MAKKLQIFEKDGKFGVATEEAFVPQYTFESRAEAQRYLEMSETLGETDMGENG